MSWHPAVVLVAVIDVALILGIATVTVVQRLARAARWRARREVRALIDSSLRHQGYAAVDRVVANADGRLGLRARAQARIEARLLRKLPVTVLLPRLLVLADCGKERLVLASLGAIGENPSAYAGALVMLTQLVRHGRPRERFVASWAGLRILAKCPEMLEAIQRDLLPDVRLMVVRAAGCVLDRGDVRAVEAEDVVRQAMNDPEAPIRRAGILVLSRLAGQGALLELFVEAMNDSMLEVRVAAARAIAAAGKTLDAHWLCQALAQADLQTGEAFLIALTHSDRSIPEEIVRIALDDRAQHRTAAIWLLGASRYRSAQHALAQLLQSPDQQRRLESSTAAAWAARKAYPERLDGVLVEQLLSLIGGEAVPAIVVHVAEALAYSGDSRVPAALVKRIPFSSGSVRERLVEAGALFENLKQWSDERQKFSMTAV